VDDELAKLVDMARGGVLDLFQQLVSELRARSVNHPEVLVEFAKAPEEICRRAAIQAAAGRTEKTVLDAIKSLAIDPVPYVRQSLAYVLTDHLSWPMNETAEQLLGDLDSNVRVSGTILSPRAACSMKCIGWTASSGPSTGWIKRRESRPTAHIGTALLTATWQRWMNV
jgi:hypothetical protein